MHIESKDNHQNINTYNLSADKIKSNEDIDKLSQTLASTAKKINSCTAESSNPILMANKARQLKKITKQVIQELENSNSRKIKSLFLKKNKMMLNNLKSNYKDLEKNYDNLVLKNEALSSAREISQLIRKTRNPSLTTEEIANRQKFDNLCKDFEIFEPNLKLLSAPKNEKVAKDWEAFRTKLLHAHGEIQASLALKEKNITWLHGTRSPAMEVMLATDQALYPTGLLLKHKIIPLTGELGIGILPDLGVNNKSLSGTSLSKLGVSTTISYANDFKAKASSEWKYLEVNKLRDSIHSAERVLQKDPNLQGQFGYGVRFDFMKAALYVGRLKVIDPNFDKKISELKNNLNNLIEECRQKNLDKIVELLQNVLGECDAPPFIQPTPQLLESVLNSFPIVLGSLNVQGVPFAKSLDEHIVSGAVSLKHIQVAFTEPDRVDQLKESIKKSGLYIEVMDFDALKLLSVKAPEIGEGFSGKS